MQSTTMAKLTNNSLSPQRKSDRKHKLTSKAKDFELGKKKKKGKKKVNDDERVPAVEKIRVDLIAAPPASPTVNRIRGKCHAMGDDCIHPSLESERHNCKLCGDYCHAISPCGYDTGNGLVCFNCNMKADYEDDDDDKADEDDDDDDDVKLPSIPPMPAVEDALEEAAPSVDPIVTQEESDVEEIKINGRGKSFRPCEDFLLTRAWISVSADSRNGTGQKRDVFAAKLKRAYDALAQEHNSKNKLYPSERCLDRTANSIFARWKNTIRPECSKWAGVCKQIKLSSGEDVDQVTARRQKAFAITYKGHPFRFIDSYELLKDLPKWSELDDGGRTGKKKKKKKKKEQRSIGKRQQALNDKCEKIATSIGFPAAPTTTATAGVAMISQQIENLTNHLMVSDWDEELQRTFQKNQATILQLQQQKKIEKLKTELAEERAKQATFAASQALEDELQETDSDEEDDDSAVVTGHYEGE